MGRQRSDIAEGYYSFPQGEHVLFSLIRHDGMDIIGIPHKEMDIISYSRIDTFSSCSLLEPVV